MPQQNRPTGWKGKGETGTSAVENNTIPIEPKLNKRFYEALLLLNIMNKVQGEHIREDTSISINEPSDLLDEREAWRAFLKSAAYICDAERGGSTVTALLAELTPQGVVLWIASNECSQVFDRKTFEYLTEILQLLTSLQEENASLVENYIATRSLEFCSKRLKTYRNLVETPVRHCIQYLEQQKGNKATIIKTWLHRVIDQLGNPRELCRMCYNDRHSLPLQQIIYFTGPSNKNAQDFAEVRHFVGRLGQNFKAARAIVHAAQLLPRLFDGIRVRRLSSSRPLGPPLRERKPSLSEIVGRMTSNATDQQEIRNALFEMDRMFGGDYSKELKKECLKDGWRPRVHAELILLNWAHSQQMTFVNGDRYIACSKPACYCCYYYINEHPGGFATPACHNNTYLNWRAPDILVGTDNYMNEDRIRKITINRLLQNIREDARRQILGRCGPRARQHDSTTGISSNISTVFQATSDPDSEPTDWYAAKNTADEADEPLSSTDEEPTDPFEAKENNLLARMASNDIDDMIYPRYSGPKSFVVNVSATEVGEFSDGENEGAQDRGNGKGSDSDSDSDSDGDVILD